MFRLAQLDHKRVDHERSKTPDGIGAGGIDTGGQLRAARDAGDGVGGVGDDGANGHLAAPIWPALRGHERQRGNGVPFPPDRQIASRGDRGLVRVWNTGESPLSECFRPFTLLLPAPRSRVRRNGRGG